ncbi:MAG: peptidylprolyl isomerase [Nanoarchaeota archaeon]
MPLKNKDFIEIEFVARIKGTNQIFDLTSEEIAKKEKIHYSTATYGPTIICLGENQVIKGLDQSLIGKEPKKEYKIEVSAENAFGKKDPKLLKLIPLRIFKKQNIQPYPGLQVNIDNLIGTIRTVSSGRSIVDFNHPLAGHDVVYEIKINKLVTNDTEKVNSILKFFIKNPKSSIKENKLTIDSEIPKPLQEILEKKIKELIPKIKEIKFAKTTNKT